MGKVRREVFLGGWREFSPEEKTDFEIRTQPPL
jgi:hypothetical protein